MDACAAWVALDEEIRPDTEVQSLACLHKGARGKVVAVSTEGSAVTIGDLAGSTVERRLIELGFVPGETIEVVEEIRPGGDPIAVRIGTSIFALRRREARAVLIELAVPTAKSVR